MGRVETDWSTPVTKTLNGVVVLPTDHPLIKKKTAPLEREYNIAKSACCQCNFCTQLCPRNALGLGVQPHKVMRSLGYGNMEALGDINSVFGCCNCGLCSLYACNMGLSPGKMVNLVKESLLKKGIKPRKELMMEVSETREYVKVPSNRFVQRLGLSEYDVAAPLIREMIHVDEVDIPLKQHIGVASTPNINVGEMVQEGDLIGKMNSEKLSANVHASISGEIRSISNTSIKIINNV